MTLYPISMMTRRPLGVAVLLGLTGCDVLLVSPSMPGLVPGLGQPLRGQVLDSQSGHPIGGATVLADIGWATTDNAGKFAIYGAISRRNLSLARAGYGSVTFETGHVPDDRAYFLDALFPSAGELTARRGEIVGKVQTSFGAIDGEVVFAGVKNGLIKDGKFAIPEVRVNLPGTIFSGLLAGGEVSGGPIFPEANQAEQRFNFKDYGNGTLGFGYSFFDVPFSPTGSPTVPTWTLPTPIAIGTLGTKARVNYKNIAWARDVKTEITLDFGILGSVPVARGFGSKQDLPIPSVTRAKYLLEGTAHDGDRMRISRVVITTNVPQDEPFDLLTPPEPMSPTRGAKGLGGRPTFSWSSVPGAEVYLVEVFEPQIVQPKWRGFTTQTAIAFPFFGDGDSNGGALGPGVKYTWAIHAIGSKYGGSTPKDLVSSDVVPASLLGGVGFGHQLRTPAEILGIKAGPPFRPFRKKIYEAVTRGMEFSR